MCLEDQWWLPNTQVQNWRQNINSSRQPTHFCWTTWKLKHVWENCIRHETCGSFLCKFIPDIFWSECLQKNM